MYEKTYGKWKKSFIQNSRTKLNEESSIHYG